MERNPRVIEAQMAEELEHNTPEIEALDEEKYDKLLKSVERFIEIVSLENQNGPYGEEFKKLYEEVTASNLEVFSESLATGAHLMETVQALNLLCECKIGYVRMLALDVVENNSSIISSNIKGYDSRRNYPCALALWYLQGRYNMDEWDEVSPEKLTRAWTPLSHSLKNLHLSPRDAHLPHYEDILQFMEAHGKKGDRKRAGAQLATFRMGKLFNWIPLQYQKFFTAWKEGVRENYLSDFIEANLRVIGSLEKARPGIVSYLYKEWGICDFARYPEEALISQYDNRENIDLPYGIIIYPRADYNGAFNYPSPIYNLHEAVLGKYLIRISEARDKIDIVRHLAKLRRLYGATHRISFAIIGGHGTENSINFGNSPDYYRERYTLSSDDLIDSRSKKSKYFMENPTIILQSCSTGKQKGIGQKLSALLGANIIAPPIPTNVKTFGVSFAEDEKLEFNVSYMEGESAQYQAGMPVEPKEK